MAIDATGAAYLGTSTDDALQQHLRRLAIPDLFANYELIHLATEAEVPANQGLVMIIPEYTNDTDHGVLTTPRVADANAAYPMGSSIASTANLLRDLNQATSTVALKYYADGFKFDKIYARSVAIDGSMERAAKYLMVGSAQSMERLVQNRLLYETDSDSPNPDTAGGVIWNGLTAPGYTANEPIYANPEGGTTTWAGLVAGDFVTANGFAQARKYLRKRGNPGFSQLGGRFAAVVGPETVHRLTTSVTPVSGQAALTFENESMNQTAVFADSAVGDLFGFRLFESNYAREIADSVANAAGATAAAGTAYEYNFLFAPDAFFVCPHAAVNPGVIVKGFNEGGALNPTNSLASISVDYLFGAARASNNFIGSKLVLMPCPTS